MLSYFSRVYNDLRKYYANPSDSTPTDQQGDIDQTNEDKTDSTTPPEQELEEQKKDDDEQPEDEEEPYEPLPDDKRLAHGDDGKVRGLFTVTGRRTAILVACTYGGHATLRGTHNDLQAVLDVFTTKFQFSPDNITILTDEPNFDAPVYQLLRPTKGNILATLINEQQKARSGDSVFFMFAGHGTSVKDRNGDEVDGYDEAICTVSELSDDEDGSNDSKKADGKDTENEEAKQEDDGDNNASGEEDKKGGAESSDNVDKSNNNNSVSNSNENNENNDNNNGDEEGEEENENIILDDELAAIFSMFPKNCRILGLFDCCRSGTILDLPYYQDPFDSSNTGICRQVDQKSKSFKRYIQRRNITEVREPPVFQAEVIQISACRDRQTAREEELDIGSDTAGALTTAFIHEISISGPEGAPLTYSDIMQAVHVRLRNNNLGQVPQFWTSHRFDLKYKFVL